MDSKQLRLRVVGMHCGGCEGKVRRSLESLPGVKNIVVERANERTTLTSEVLGAQQVMEVITDLGFSASLAEES
jgi:copper chaperone CopZ